MNVSVMFKRPQKVSKTNIHQNTYKGKRTVDTAATKDYLLNHLLINVLITSLIIKSMKCQKTVTVQKYKPPKIFGLQLNKILKKLEPQNVFQSFS